MVVDTGVFVDLLRGQAKAGEYIARLEETVKVSRLTVMELIRGVSSKLELKKLTRQMEALQPIDVVEVNEEISMKAGEIFAGHWLPDSLGIIDSFIGATAMELGEVLVTKNKKHFKNVTGLDLIVPY